MRKSCVFAVCDIKHVIAKPENHLGSLGAAPVGASQEEDKRTLRVNQARLKVFRSESEHPSTTVTRPRYEVAWALADQRLLRS